jgi:hypothetical protein
MTVKEWTPWLQVEALNNVMFFAYMPKAPD